jgi:hypothetical protein
LHGHVGAGLGSPNAEFDLPLSDATNEPALAAAQARVRNDIDSAQRSGAQVAQAIFIHGCAMPVISSSP